MIAHCELGLSSRAPLRLCVSLLLLSVTAFATDPVVTTVDHGAAARRGIRAFGVWLQLPNDPKPRLSSGYDVVLTKRASPREWLRFPAGTWQLPPAGAYNVLLEGKDEVSPWPSNLTWSWEPYAGRGLAATRSVVPAARIHVSGACASEPCTAWILHETSNVQVPVPYFSSEMLRQAPLREATTSGVLMPLGKLAVAIYSESAKRFVGLAAPVQATTKGVVKVQTRAPTRDFSGLILDLVRPTLVLQQPADDVKTVRLVLDDGSVLAPSILTRTHRKLIAVWPKVRPGHMRVEVESAGHHVPNSDFRLQPSQILHLTRDLLDLPKLSVDIEATDRMPDLPKELVVTDLLGRSAPNTVKLSTEDNHTAISVVPSLFKLTLKFGVWEVTKEVDLSDGRDRTVTLSIESFRLSGRVFYGNEPTSARLNFDTTDDEKRTLTVDVEADGKYEAFFVRPRLYTVLVYVAGRGIPYIAEPVFVGRDRTHDIVIPANRYAVHVKNRRDGLPLEGAEVGIENMGDDGMSSQQRVASDQRGDVIIQPLRPGKVRIVVSKAGFVTSEPHEEPVVQGEERNLAFSLEPDDNTEVLRLIRADGSPAANAEVYVIAEETSFTIKTTDDGTVKVPHLKPGTILLVRAPAAALSVLRVSAADKVWILEEPAGPLNVEAVSADRDRVPHVAAVLWIDGVRLSGGILAWLTGTAAGTDASGMWTVNGLPKRTVDVMFWVSTPENYRIVPSGLFDSMRTAVPYPWDVSVRVPVIK